MLNPGASLESDREREGERGADREAFDRASDSCCAFRPRAGQVTESAQPAERLIVKFTKAKRNRGLSRGMASVGPSI